MSYLQDFYHSLRALSAVRPEQKAVPFSLAKHAVRGLAQGEGQQNIYSMAQSNRRRETENSLKNYRQDISMAKRDVIPATVLGVGNIALSTKTAIERDKMAKDQEERNKQLQRDMEDITNIMNKHSDVMSYILKYGVLPDKGTQEDFEKKMMESRNIPAQSPNIRANEQFMEQP